MKLFITGATGLIGSRLVTDRLERGDEVLALSRGADRARRRLDADRHDRLTVVEGDATRPGPWRERVAGCDAVIHLAGAGVGDRRWTEAYKRVIADSRLDSTRQVVEAIAAADPRPGTLVNASAVGYYGDRGDERLEETAPPGEGFLESLCVRWEAQARAAEAHARVVMTRFGAVLDERGGALQRLLPIFRLGLGGPIGRGRQYLPWVHWRDVTGLIDLALGDRTVRGPVNVVSPEPVTNRAFSTTLGRVLRRPAWLPVPPPALRVLLGEFARYLVASQRVVPARARRHGYRHEHPQLRPALEALLR